MQNESDFSDKRILSLSREESYYYWFHCVKNYFALVTNGTNEDMPTQAYFYPVGDVSRVFNEVEFRYLSELWIPSKPFHAIHIKINDDLDRPSLPVRERVNFEVSVFDPVAITSWSDRVVIGFHRLWPVPQLWQTKLWEKCLLKCPPSYRMEKEAAKFSQGKKISTRNVAPDIKGGSLRLFLVMMDRFWMAQNYNFEMRANMTSNAGVEGIHTPSSIRIQTSNIGLRKAIVSELKSQVSSIRKKAQVHLSDEEKFYAETREFPTVAFPVPDAIDDELSDGKEKSYDDFLVRRLIRNRRPRY